MTDKEKLAIVVEAVLKLYGHISILPTRDAEIVEMLNRILKEGGEK